MLEWLLFRHKMLVQLVPYQVFPAVFRGCKDAIDLQNCVQIWLTEALFGFNQNGHSNSSYPVSSLVQSHAQLGLTEALLGCNRSFLPLGLDGGSRSVEHGSDDFLRMLVFS